MVVGVGVGEDVGDLLTFRQRLYVGLTIGERVGVGARRLGDYQCAVDANRSEERRVGKAGGYRWYGVRLKAVDVGVVVQQDAADRFGRSGVLHCRSGRASDGT